MTAAITKPLQTTAQIGGFHAYLNGTHSLPNVDCRLKNVRLVFSFSEKTILGGTKALPYLWLVVLITNKLYSL